MAVLADVVSGWIVVADNQDLSFAVLLHANAKLRRVLPNHLRKMSRSRRFRLDSERVLLYLVIPGVDGILPVHLVIRVGAGIKSMHI